MKNVPRRATDTKAQVSELRRTRKARAGAFRARRVMELESGRRELEEWDGDAHTHQRHKRRVKRFKTNHHEEFHEFPRFFAAQDPKVRGRIEREYTVPEPAGDEDPPPGKCGFDPGDTVERETPEEFNCNYFFVAWHPDLRPAPCRGCS